MIRLDELGQGKYSSSNNSSLYKHGQADEPSVKTNYLRSSFFQSEKNRVYFCVCKLKFTSTVRCIKQIINNFKTCYIFLSLYSLRFKLHLHCMLINWGGGGQRGYAFILLRRDLCDLICPSTEHFVLSGDFYREISFHEHMLTLLISAL